ncbi:MAG: hypothetical protein ACRDOB_06620 [Streptosporangiaceae bacterium]
MLFDGAPPDVADKEALLGTALAALARAADSPRRPARFDIPGQVTAVLALGGVTYGCIEGGSTGFGAVPVIAAFTVAVIAFATFLAVQARGSHPMVPLALFRSRPVAVLNSTLSMAAAANCGKSASMTCDVHPRHPGRPLPTRHARHAGQHKSRDHRQSRIK